MVLLYQVLTFSGGKYISGIEHTKKFIFSKQTYLAHMNTIISEYCHASLILSNVDVLYLEDGNVYRPAVKNVLYLKNHS